MVYQVDFNVLADNRLVNVQTALIHALNVSECKVLADEIATENLADTEELILDIQEMDE